MNSEVTLMYKELRLLAIYASRLVAIGCWLHENDLICSRH